MFKSMKKWVVMTSDAEESFSSKVEARDYARYLSRSGERVVLYKRWKSDGFYMEEIFVFSNGSLSWSERKTFRIDNWFFDCSL